MTKIFRPSRLKKPRKASTVRERKIIGWQEKVALPDLGIHLIKAKIDTGARTSALHAINMQPFEENGEKWISFEVPTSRKTVTKRHSVRVVDWREIKNTGGIPEARHIIATRLIIGNRRWLIEMSLTDREHMAFDLILGRTAIRRHRLLVAPDQSFLAGPPKLGQPKPRRFDKSRAKLKISPGEM